MKRMHKTTIALIVALSAIFAAQSAAASVVLFADTFDDELSDINGTPNASVSGTFAELNADNYSTLGSGGSYTETGGIASVTPAIGESAMLITLWDYATDSDLQTSGSLTISLTDIVPAAGSDWISINLMTGIPNAVDDPWVNDSPTVMSALFKGDATAQVFTYGTKVDTDSWSTDDVSIELTNLTGVGTGTGSFNYAVFSGATIIHSGLSSGDLSNLYVGIESRGGTSTLSALSITTVPEPSSAALLAGCLALSSVMMLRRRR